MDAGAGEHPHSTITHTGIKERAVESNHGEGSAQYHADCERVSQVVSIQKGIPGVKLVYLRKGRRGLVSGIELEGEIKGARPCS